MHDENEHILEFPITPNYSPVVTVDIIGLKDNKSVVAIVDTGFTGFIQIPLSLGIATNLRLFGIRPGKLADGRTVKNLECFGGIRFAGKDLYGLISLSDTGDECLLGMQFLNELKSDFTVSPPTNKAIFKWKTTKLSLDNVPTAAIPVSVVEPKIEKQPLIQKKTGKSRLGKAI